VTTPPWAAEQGVAGLLNTGDVRVLDAKWFGDKLWFGLNNSCLPNGDFVNRSCIRIVQIDTSLSTIARNFDLSANGMDYYYPALGIDSFGNVPVIFGFSSLNDYPSLAVTGHLETDSPNSWASPQIIVRGSILAVNARYGDYFGAGVDPSDPTVTWVAGEYHDASIGTNCSFRTCWSTYIAKLKLTSSLSSSYTFSRQSNDITSSVTFAASTLGGSSPYSFSWSFGDGVIASGNSVTHIFHKAGIYSVTLKISDSAGQQAASSQPLMVTITPNEEFTLDWADYNNDGRVVITDTASFFIYYDIVCETLAEPDRSICNYWDYDLAGRINIVDLARLAIWYGFQTDAGTGRPAYAMDPKWHGCTMLSGDTYNFCSARGI
jgi:PKD repeat protein